MHFVIAGGSGYVGAHLCMYLRSKQEQITILTRSNVEQIADSFFKRFGIKEGEFDLIPYAEYKGEGDVLINLAGESLGARRINSRLMQVIKNSRNTIFEQLYNYPTLPKVFMQASAVSCYPNSPQIQNEQSPTDSNSDFGGLALMLEQNTARLHEKFNFDAYYNLRLGIVLSRDGGFMRKLSHVPPFKLLKGDNLVPFVSVEDVCSAIYFLAKSQIPSGPVNLTTPETASLNELLACCFKNKWLPTFPVLSCFIHTTDKRSQLLLANQNITPQILLDAGFTFKHNNLSNI